MAGYITRHYEKVIALCCFLILFTNVGLPSTSFSVYQPYLVEIPGVGHSGGSIVIAVRTFLSLIAMLFVGRYYDILDCRVGAFVASICVAVGFLLYSFNTTSFAGLCTASVFTGLGYGLGGMIASTMLINRWFRSNVGTVAGIAAMGSGVAAVILPNLVVSLINSFDLAAAFRFEAALAFALGLTVFLLLRNRPADMGLAPYEKPEKPAADGAKKHTRRNRDASPRLLPLLYFAMFCVGSLAVGGTSYLAVLFTSEGFSVEAAASLVAVNGACLMVAKFACGIVFDKVGTRNGSIAFFALLIIGVALLCLSDMGAAGIASAAVVFYGLGISLGSVGISVWSIELSPSGMSAKTIKNFQLCYATGGFVFSTLPGFLMEAFGTYLVVYVALLIAIIAAAAIVVCSYVHCEHKAARRLAKETQA